MLGAIWPVCSRLRMVRAMSSEESMGAKRTRAMWAAMRKVAEVRAMAVVAARCWRRLRSSQAMAGPMAKAARARAAGRRRAAKEGPVRSKRQDMERV